MRTRSGSRPTDGLRNYSLVSAYSVILVGGTTLIGWGLGFSLLESFQPNPVRMKANAALAFVLAGVSLRLLLLPSESRKQSSPKAVESSSIQVAHACAVVVALIGVLTLTEYLSGWDLKIDQMIFSEPVGAAGTSSPGRMSPNAALNFVFMGLALLFLDRETRRGRRPAQYLALVAGTVAALGLVGRLYGALPLYRIESYTEMAWNTGITFILLSTGVITALPEVGIMALLIAPGAAGILIRRLLPAAVFLPIVLGWMALEGQLRGLAGKETGLALFAISSAAAFAFLVYGIGAVLDRKDAEKRKAGAALKESEERFRRLAENAPDVIYRQRLKPVPECEYVSPAVLATSGYAPGEFYGDPGLALNIVHPEDRGVLQEVLKGNVPAEPLELRWIRKDGTTIWTEQRNVPVYDDAGNCVVIEGIARDITRMKEIEEALRASNEELGIMSQQIWQAAKLSALGELAASIAHELNNPLSTVTMCAELLRPDFPEDHASRQLLDTIDEEVQRMSGLVKNLLQFTRRSHSQISTLDVRDEIERTLELVHFHLYNRQIEVVREFSSGLPMIQADRQKLRQLFLNLLTNASDAMPRGGTLTIRVRAENAETREGQPPAHEVSRPRSISIEIADTGDGIPGEALSVVMQPFFTTKPEGKGTGLGLSICRRIVAEHHGMLHLESAVGEGTTVRVSLPLHNEANSQGVHEFE